MLRNDFLPFSKLTSEEKNHIYSELGLSDKQILRCNELWSANKDTLYNPFTMQKIEQSYFRFGTVSLNELKSIGENLKYLNFNNKYECLVHANSIEHQGIPYSGVVKENGTGQIVISGRDYKKYMSIIENNALSFFPKSLGRVSRKTILEEGYYAEKGIPFDKAISLCVTLRQHNVRYRLEIKSTGECVLYFPAQSMDLVKSLLSVRKKISGITL